MRQLGTIKWFMCELSEKQKWQQDYDGVINVKDSKLELFFSRKHVLCNESELLPGTYVTFKVGADSINCNKEALEVKLLKDEQDRNILEYCSVLDYKSMIDIAFQVRDKNLKNLWKCMKKECKILFLYKASRYDLKSNIIENLSENDKLIRSMLLILWAKDNQPNKEIIFKKSLELLNEYIAILDYEKEKEVLELILPKEEKRALSASVQWYEWNLFQFIEASNKNPLIDELEDESKYVSKLTLLVNELIKIKEKNKEAVS
ncbi:MAG: hypothetical protein Q8936_07445 [Bacillota bacterium]|nr:hypothetical protein [Bacillota bacterium]